MKCDRQSNPSALSYTRMPWLTILRMLVRLTLLFSLLGSPSWWMIPHWHVLVFCSPVRVTFSGGLLCLSRLEEVLSMV